MYLLHIETSSTECSICLSSGEEVLSEQSSGKQHNKHSRLITLLCREALEEGAVAFQDLDAISVSSGPGSFTGLRIGASAAKGFCYGLNVPLIGVSTLESLAKAVARKEDVPEDTLLLPMIDARRMEVYTARFNSSGQRIDPEDQAVLVTYEWLEEISKGYSSILLAGDGTGKVVENFGSSGNLLDSGIRSSASQLVQIAVKKFNSGDFSDISTFTPHYLKSPNITTSKKLFL